jgi:hypothetical protein
MQNNPVCYICITRLSGVDNSKKVAIGIRLMCNLSIYSLIARWSSPCDPRTFDDALIDPGTVAYFAMLCLVYCPMKHLSLLDHLVCGVYLNPQFLPFSVVLFAAMYLMLFIGLFEWVLLILILSQPCTFSISSSACSFLQHWAIWCVRCLHTNLCHRTVWYPSEWLFFVPEDYVGYGSHNSFGTQFRWLLL